MARPSRFEPHDPQTPGERRNRPRPLRPEILFENSSTLVISKPAGLPVIPGRSPQDRPSLKEWLEKRSPGTGVYVVHRIDKPVSGAVLFARTPPAHRHYCSAFERGSIDKRYLAVVEGSPAEDKGAIEIPLVESRGLSLPAPKSAVRHARCHRTSFVVLERFHRYCLLELRTHTGFHHQIRAHLKAIGLPLAVDPLYGRRDSLRLSDLKGRERYKPAASLSSEPALIDRVSLHASSLSFEEYETGRWVEIAAPAPRDFRYLIKALRKYDLSRPGQLRLTAR
jgi:RluA family pseudouridine synthase